MPAGAQVIVQGQDFVREGQRVEAVPAADQDRRAVTHARIARNENNNAEASSTTPYRHARLTIATLLFLLAAGYVAYVTIPKEAEPDVKVPMIYVQLSQRGISPEDAERLLLRPVETQLKSVGNVKEMRSTAFEGGGFVLLEFEAGFDSKSALADVRAKVDNAKHDLPQRRGRAAGARKSTSRSIRCWWSALSGDVPERTMLRIARAAKNAIEQAPGVLAGRAARRARRGGGDHRRSPIADEQLRPLARTAQRAQHELQHA